MGTKTFWRTLSVLAASSVAAGALASCNRSGGSGDADTIRGRPDGPQFESRQASSKRAGLPASRDFAFVRYAIDVTQDLPRACLSFSSTLDPDRDYDPYIAVSPAAPVALVVDGANLCVGGLTFGQQREITLRAGFPSQDGRTLPFDETISVEFGDRPAFVGFKGDGVILPRVEADGLALETVNVDKVKVTISRITDRALAFKTITQGYSASQGGYGYMDYGSDAGDVAEQLWTGEIDTPGSSNAAATTVFPIATAIPRLQAGAYFVELDQIDASGKTPDDAARAKRWLIITDLALTTFTGGDGMSATVRSIQSAKPMRSVKIELIARNNEILARGDSDANGHVRFSGPVMRGEGNAAPRMLMAYGANGDFAILDLDRSPIDLTERDIGGREPAAAADAFVYMERGVYRPGETVKATSLVRDAAANAITDRPGSLVVYGPNGLEAGRQRFNGAKEAGSVRYDFVLPKAAARGEWRMTTEIDGAGVVGQASFSVEDFVPQRIALQLRVDADTPIGRNQTRTVDANVRFLYGAPGAGLPVESSVRVEPDANPFPQLAGYAFGRHDEEFRESTFDLANAVTDGAGNTALVIDPRQANAESSRPLRLRAVVSAIEPGGRPVRDDVRIAYRPNDRYVGVKPAFEAGSAAENKPAVFDVVSVDRSGATKAAEINWRLVRIDWKYDWYRADGGAWQWRQSREIVQVEEGTARIAEGQSGKITTRELEWGDYELVLMETANAGEASYGFWAGWGGQPQAGGVEAPDRVRLSVPDTLPAIGSEIEIGIMPPYAGEAEIVVASENVILTRTISVKADGARVKIPVTKEWGAGVYIMASVYTPRDPVDRPKPRRAVGVAHMAVDVSTRTFNLTLTAPEIQRPRSQLKVEVAATSGPIREDAYVTVAAVDEGILLLTRFQSPNPVEYFFGKRRLGVELRDDYGRLLDPNQGAAAAVRSGGDQIGGAGLTVVPTKTVALFSGPVKLDNRGRATVTIDVPDFNGELRLMAVAWSETGLGSASQPLTVRDQVPAEVILPRFLAPGDEAFATVTLDNVEGGAGAYRAALTSTGPFSTATPNVSATLAARQRQDITVPISSSAEGVSNVSVQVTGPNNYTVAHSYGIQTRSPYLPASNVERRMIQPGETFSPRSDSLATFIAGSGGVQVSFSPIPMDAAALLDSLERYPYGCTEQITSRALPLLYAGQMAALAGRQTPGDIRNQVQDAISTLLNRQGADGAIGLWRVGDRQATPWLGAYATDFLARAKTAGYVVPDAALDKAYDALEEFAVRESTWSTGYAFEVYESRWNPDTAQLLMDRSVAYASYVLARAGRMDKSRLRYLHDDRMNRIPSALARAQIGAALYMIGDNARAKSSFDQAERALGYQNEGDYYATPRRDLAGVLALAGEARAADRVQRLASRVGQDLPEPDRLTTQEKAFLLLAANSLSGGATAVNVGVRGAATPVSPGRVFRLDETQSRQPPTFTNSGAGPLWVTSVARGSPASAPPPAADGLTVDKQLWTPSGQAINGSAFTQGDRVIIAISAASSEARQTPLIIADLLPAGFEIEAVLRPEDAGATGPYRFLGELDIPNIAEARDDRFVAAIDLFDREAATLAYMVRAVTPGEFSMPGAVAEDMYRPDTFGRTPARTITVARRN
ncbi:MAG: alpha-2-macroglobulin [Alphaproteobacteria bacterium]|nr:alpha-2-macroglobulin [Alphaproteobacteria bacterium]